MRSRISTGFLLSALLSWLQQQSTAEVMSLTDQTFEHETQASTGMTTGSWLVLFTIPFCAGCEKLKPVLEEMSRDEVLYEQGVVLGTVDCSENIAVCQRFSVSTLPTVLYLHKNQLYKFPAVESLTNNNNNGRNQEDAEITAAPSMADQLKSFVLKDFATTEAVPIPEPPSIMDAVMEPFTRLYEAGMESPLLGVAILLMASMLFLTVLVLVYVVVIRSQPTGEEASTKKKKKN